MKKNPLIYFVGGAIVCAVLLVFVARDRWQSSQAAVDTIASVSQGTSDTQTAETAPDNTKEQAGATQQQAAVEPQAEPAEPEVSKKNNLVEQTDPAPAKINITPTFDIVRVEEDGAAVIAGRAEPGAEIMLTLNGDTVAETVANERGEWVVTPSDPLPKGSHNLQIVAKLDGETRQSDQVVAVAVPDKEEEQPLIVLSKPSEPSRVLQKPEPAPETQPAAETQQTAEAEQTAEANQTAETQRVAEAQTQTADQTQSEAQAPTTRETSEQAVAAVEDTARQQQAEAQQSQTDEASKSETTAEASSQQTEEQAAQDTGTTSEPAQEQTVAAVDTTAEPADTAPAAKESKLETAPTPVITKPLILETVDYNDAGDIIFAGKAEPGKTVRIYVDNQHVGDAIANNDGRWSF